LVSLTDLGNLDRVTCIGKGFDTLRTMMWLLATVYSGMSLQATLLGECLFAPLFWAEKGPFPRVDPEMSFKIRLAKKTLLLVRTDLRMETV
jgi:hypothetical protein